MAHPRDRATSHTYQAVTTRHPADSTVLLPFSGKLRVDKELKLSHKDFKQSIEQFYGSRQLSAIDQIKATPHFPTPCVLAQFASMAYRNCKHGDPKPPDGWKLLTTASNTGDDNGYFGTAYWQPEHQQVVIAHRGTDTNNFDAFINAIYTDLKGVLFKNYVPQMNSASTFANKVVAVLKEIEKERKVSFDLFFTGHSLGGWLAQITTFTTEYLEEKGGTFLMKRKREGHEPLASSTVQDNHDVRHSYHPHTIVFDSPGCRDMLEQMADKFDVRHKGHSIDLQQLNITSYLSAPNRINTCNSHLGTVYRIFIDLSDMSFFEKHTPLYNLATHRMEKIVQTFDSETGNVRKDGKDGKGKLKIQEVVDWPVCAGLLGDAELNEFFKWAEHLNDYHPEVKDMVPSKLPHGYTLLRYQTKAFDECTNSLRVFSQDEREFLQRYRWLCDVKELFRPKDLFSEMNGTDAEEEAEEKLQNFELVNESVRCPDASKLLALISYVKRLVRLFPHITEKLKDQLSSHQRGNRVYHYETQRYIGKIRQSAVDFNPGSLSLTEFLTSDQQIWLVRMIDGDAWTGLTKVYSILQNPSCTLIYSSEGHYTILKLKRFLTLNRMIKFNALLTEIGSPHLLIIACETNQPVNDELENMLQELFNILKQKNTLKIILTTQTEDSTADLIEHIATITLGEGFITTEEQLTWSDLEPSSERKILEKTVIFQGRPVALNQLISAESMTDSFPLADLLKETELRIGKEHLPSACSGYNEKYYIDRTFNHKIVIRQDILSDKRQGKFTDLLAGTEEEFKQLCEQYPNINVHWLVEEKPGEIVWQQSQGNFETLRNYIDEREPHSYALSNLDTFLEQVKHKRVMLIADKAGMGKTTVLTHMSKGIKQKYPAHWLVRIDLNDCTEQLNAQKGKKMDKGRLLEFLTTKVLKLESHLEKELFKESFEGKGVNKLVIMMDGFDEISPTYKETVLDMLQVLKQTSLEQLWVTTRPHLKYDLEDSLQHLSYTLQPFSEVEQVGFLKKLWTQHLDSKARDHDRLQIFAEALIRNLAKSISDKDKEFTGIPLQTRMLAEAFEEEFVSFYQSQKSEPDLLQKLDLLGLYKRFIDRKYNIYYQEKSRTPADNVATGEQKQRDFRNLQEEHQKLALQALFTEDDVPFLDNLLFSNEESARIGIAHRNHEDKPHFIHRTFAEYYVADFIINNFTKKSEQHKQVQEFLLNKVLLRTDCEVIRALLDGLLGKNPPSKKDLKDYGEKLDEQWNQTLTGVATALHIAAREDNAHIIEFLFQSLKSAKRLCTINNMIFAADDKGQSALILAAENRSLKAADKIEKWFKKLIFTSRAKQSKADR